MRNCIRFPAFTLLYLTRIATLTLLIPLPALQFPGFLFDKANNVNHLVSPLDKFRRQPIFRSPSG